MKYPLRVCLLTLDGMRRRSFPSVGHGPFLAVQIRLEVKKLALTLMSICEGHCLFTFSYKKCAKKKYRNQPQDLDESSRLRGL
ncbi:hypothetical protein AVEN_5025-1 [Araneus ventricosus]|uniref:Uncharacterized protein n=1 Tax=Araneus ventricosus TaxID=182803 RepID=A0A4Y2QL00_ARAVE|nr:hypothetical protein AVEN_5025-1 [Araneus ventricosus]